MDFHEIEAEALNLSRQERSDLIHRLIRSLGEASSKEELRQDSVRGQLRDTVEHFESPCKPVAEDSWEALRGDQD